MARMLRRDSIVFSLSSYPWRSSTSMAFSTLAFEEVKIAEDPNDFNSTALVLHGLLGSSRNWRSFSRKLAFHLNYSSCSSAVWRIVLPDLRNHGKSASIKGLDPPHDIASTARDLANLVKSNGWDWPDVVIGHSLGGKVALEFAMSCARGDYGAQCISPKQLWVLDSVPGELNLNNTEVERVLLVLQDLPSSLTSREYGQVHPYLLSCAAYCHRYLYARNFI